jgi:hypothetical protein
MEEEVQELNVAAAPADTAAPAAAVGVQPTLDNYDLSTFINGKKTLLISDFEGTTPTAHFDKFKDYCTTGEDKNVIFLGDIFDNTAQFSKSCSGEECGNPNDYTDECPTDANYCALQTIKLLVDNPDNCRYVFGNRDINKIKLLPFFSFADGKKWWINGESYEDIVTNLINSVKENKNIWLVNKKNIKYFRPFWKNKFNEVDKVIGIDTKVDPTGKKKENDKAYDQNKTWMEDEPNIHDIYHRFVLMFGRDADKGTMSALVTLKCIPNELAFNGLALKDNNKFFNVKDDLVSTFKMRAALTLTIFMRMLDKELWKGIKKDKPEVGTFGALDGYLYHYLMKSPAAYYAVYAENLLLFAHGGITTDFVEGDGMEEINKYEKRSMDVWDGILENKVALSGGNNYDNKICKSINNYNKKITEILGHFFNFKSYNVLSKLKETSFRNDAAVKNLSDWNWERAMLILLELSAGSKQNPNQVKEPSTDILDTYADDFTKIYNVFGHASSSAGYSISKVAKSNKTFYINTDFSTTLYKDAIACDVNTYNNNYLIAVLDTTNKDLKLTLDGKVIPSSKYKKKSDLKGTIEEYIENEKKGKGNKKEYYFDDGTDLIEEAYEFNKKANVLEKLDELVKPKFCDFNGIATKNGVNYNVFSTRFRDVTGTKLIYFAKLAEPLGLESSTDPELTQVESTAGGRRHRKTHRKHPRKTLKKNKKNKRNARKTKHKKALKTKRRL